MSLKFEIATVRDAAEIAALRCAVSHRLTAQFGVGHWSGNATEKGVLHDLRHTTVYVMRRGDHIIATLNLATKKPWAIDRTFFHDSKRPLYLTSMAVAPDLQREGIGRQCISSAIFAAKKWPADAIRLDAYDADAGAGDFYRKCGFQEVGRAVYRDVPLIYFEMLL